MWHHRSGPGKGVNQDLEGCLNLLTIFSAFYQSRKEFVGKMGWKQRLLDILSLRMLLSSTLYKGRMCKPHDLKLEHFSYSKYSLPSDSTVISVLPGSRLQEVERMLPIYAKAIELLKEKFPKLVTLIHVASNPHVEHYIGESLREWPVPSILVPSGSVQLKYEAFGVSQAALCTSGTVAVELQLARLPCVVAYKAHFLTELLIRYKAKIPYISLPNILLDSPIIPEALFQACSPSNLSSILRRLLLDKNMRDKQVVAVEKLTKLMYPSERGMSNSLHGRSPSMLAASTILCYVKP